jgi:hypothetical protein
MRVGALRLAIGVVWLAACADTRDVYVGSDIPGPVAQDAAGTAGRTETPSSPAVADAAEAPSSPARVDAGQPSSAGEPAEPTQPEGPPSCAAGFADCDGDPQNGCEVETDTDELHCGGCGVACHADGPRVTAAACVAGACRLTCQFAPVYGDCDGDPDNGCEIDLFHDADNCGTCGMRCTRCADSLCL